MAMHQAARPNLAAHIWVEAVRSDADLMANQEAWKQLANEAVEANAFYEPYLLIPAWEWLRQDAEIQVLLVWLGTGAERRLVGLLPVERAKLSDRLPFRSWQPWRHKYCFLCVPLVDRAYVPETVAALADWLAASGPVAAITTVSGGWLDDAVTAQGERMAMGAAGGHNRAYFAPAESADQYLNAAISGIHRKGYRRLERHLSTLGPLAYRHREGAELALFVDQFLALEAAGWKGHDGTAFACHKQDEAFFRQVIRGASQDGRLMALGLYLNGEPIALKVNFVCTRGSFSFKICYDERYSRYSPGVLLELENIRALHERGCEWMDSCADEGHPMIERLWPGRRRICTYYLGPRLAGASLAVPLAAVRRRVQERRLPADPKAEGKGDAQAEAHAEG